MATVTKKATAPKLTTAQLRAENAKLHELIDDGARCIMCNKMKKKDKFYVNTHALCKSGITPICKDCARKIALRIGEDGQEHEPTKESCIEALRWLNKPFINNVWNASIQEFENLASGKVKTNVWAAYIKNIAMGQYVGASFADSDIFKVATTVKEDKSEKEITAEHIGQDTYDSYKKNKSDVIRLLDYDPFEEEALSDQPFLYSQLLGLLDSSEDANEDMMRVSSAITIVRGFLQQSKIDNAISKLMCNIQNVEENSATIKSLQDSKQKITSIVTNLAAESCLSLKNSKHATKGENTWTGKLKKIKELNLRDGRTNGFDVNTCRGMQQVQEISDASIMKQLALDDSEWSDMVADMRVENQRLRKERDSYKEINRILLQENLDLKDYMTEKDVPIKDNLANLKDMYSVFSSVDEGIEFTGEEDVDTESEVSDEPDNPSV